jgi:uncharacterized protein YceH (UPF0502 family)
MPRIVKLEEPCNICGKEKWVEELTNVSGRLERRYWCLFCGGIESRNIKSVNDKGEYVNRKYVRRIHTERNLKDD